MLSVKKVAVFLMMLGMKKGQSILALMDNSEIKAVVSEFRSLSAVSPELQKSVWAEFKELGFEENMRPSEIVTILRFLFNGSKISDKGDRRYD